MKLLSIHKKICNLQVLPYLFLYVAIKLGNKQLEQNLPVANYVSFIDSSNWIFVSVACYDFPPSCFYLFIYYNLWLKKTKTKEWTAKESKTPY